MSKRTAAQTGLSATGGAGGSGPPPPKRQRTETAAATEPRWVSQATFWRELQQYLSEKWTHATLDVESQDNLELIRGIITEEAKRTRLAEPGAGSGSASVASSSAASTKRPAAGAAAAKSSSTGRAPSGEAGAPVIGAGAGASAGAAGSGRGGASTSGGFGGSSSSSGFGAEQSLAGYGMEWQGLPSLESFGATATPTPSPSTRAAAAGAAAGASAGAGSSVGTPRSGLQTQQQQQRTRPPLIAFLLDVLPHPNKRSNWGMREQIIHNLPNVLKAHDVIQWLFPSDLPSRAVPNAPVLRSEIELKWLQDNEEEAKVVARNVDENLSEMAKYWGLSESKDGTAFQVATLAGRTLWKKKADHEFSRLTRVLGSLSLFGLRARASALLKAISDYRRAEGVASESDQWWREALG